MRRVFFEDVCRSFKSFYFWLTVAVVLALCLFAPGQNFFKVSENMPDKSILAEALTLDRELMRQYHGYSSFEIYETSFINLVQYIPLLAALPFIPLYCDERKSGFQRFMMPRTSKRKYYSAKIGAAAASAMAAVAIGTLLMLVFCYIAYPSINTYGLTGDELELWTVQDYKEFVKVTYAYSPLCSIAGGLLAALLSVLYASLGAAVAAVLGLLVSSFTANKYIALGFPLLFYDIIAKVIFAIDNVGLYAFLMSGLTKPEVVTTGDIWFYAAKIIFFFVAYAVLFYFNSKRRDKYGV